jgi:hypothetical protein
MNIQQTARTSLYNRKRGSFGKQNSDFSTADFWKVYYKTVKKPMPFNKATKILPELCKKMANLLLESNYIILPTIGFFSITGKNIGLDKVRRRTDWKNTFKMWEEQYPDKTAEEIKLIEDKRFIYFKNKNNTQSLYITWVKYGSRYKDVKFEPVTHLKKSLGRLANNPNDKILWDQINFKEFLKNLKA